MTINFDVLPYYRHWTTLLVNDELPTDIQLGRGVKLKEGSDYLYQSDGGEGILVPLKEPDREYAVSPFAYRDNFNNAIWVHIRWENGKEDMYPARDVLLRLQDIAKEDEDDKQGFKRGDYVSLRLDSPYVHQQRGRRGKIINFDMELKYAHVKWEESGSTFGYPIGDLIMHGGTASMIPTVPGQIVISEGRMYAMIPTRAEIMYFLVDKEVIKDNLEKSTVAKFINLDTKLINYLRLDQIDEITEGFVDLMCYKAAGECITVLKTNPESEYLDKCISLNKSIQLLGEFTTDLQLKLLSFRNN